MLSEQMFESVLEEVLKGALLLEEVLKGALCKKFKLDNSYPLEYVASTVKTLTIEEYRSIKRSVRWTLTRAGFDDSAEIFSDEKLKELLTKTKIKVIK